MSFAAAVPVRRSLDLPAWIGPTVFVAVIQAAIMVGYAARFGGDPAAFVCAPGDGIGRYPFEHLHVSMSAGGHDGQMYYVIARSPWEKHPERFVNCPCYRHVRILYPALAWALSGGGHPERLLWALPAINLMAVIALAGLGAVLALRFQRSPWWGLLLPFAVNASAPALRDLTDPLATLCAFSLLAAWLLQIRAIPLALLAALAAFSREQNVAVIGIVLAASLWRRRWGTAIGLVAALALWAGWVCYLNQMYDAWPFVSVNVQAPFSGILYRLERLNGDTASAAAPIHAGGLAVLALQIGLALLLPLWRAEKTATLTAWTGAGLAILGGPSIYMDGHSYTRVFSFLPLGLWLWAVQSGRRWPALFLLPAAIYPCFAVLQVWRR